MKTVGIVSEFNPFHNGHKYLVDCARENGATHIVTVMGGHFLQRGNCAVLGKYERAKAAILGGCDLVLELPQIYACASAERFARGAVGILRACGCVDTICCGSENMPPMNVMTDAVKLLKSSRLLEFLKKGYSYPRAVSAALEESGSTQVSEILRNPNDVLALEYFKESIDDFEFMRIRRTVPHDGSLEENGIFCSASAIRKMIINGEDYRQYVAKTTTEIIENAIKNGDCPAQWTHNERGVLSVLRQMTAENFSVLPDVSEGLENRIFRAVHENDSLEDIISAVKCKRYTRARICRIIACAYLGITAEMSDTPPQYIRVIAFNDKGAQILSIMKKTARLPVLTVARDFSKLTEDAAKTLAVDIRASDMFGLCTPTVQRCGTDYYTGVLRITSGR